MASTTLKLSLAAVISACGFLATTLWYERSAPKKIRGTGRAIAYLEAGARDTQRKPNQRLVWENVQKGESLYSFDTIRAEGGATRLRMLESNAVIDLEAQSVIVLKQSAGKTSLDLLNGGMFLKNEGRGTGKGAGLEVKIGGTKLATGGKDLTMSVHRDQQGHATVAVAKGEVTAQAGAKTFALAQGKAGSVGDGGFRTEGVLQVISPPSGTTIDLSTTPTVAFRWQKVDAALQVSVEVQKADGSYTSLGSSDGASGSFATRLAPGSYNWRLVAMKPGAAARLESVTAKLTVIALSPPDLMQPSEGSSLVLKAGRVDAAFMWDGGDHFASYTLDVNKAEVKTPVFHKQGLLSPSAAVELREPGSYTWQVTGVTKDAARSLVSTVASFSVTQPVNLAVRPQAPADGQSLVAAAAASGIALSWQADPTLTSFQIKVEAGSGKESPIIDEQVGPSPYNIKLKAPGTYTWRVRAGVSGAAAPWSAARTIVVTGMAKLAWSDQRAIFESDSNTPKLKLAWSSHTGTIVKTGRIGYSISSQMNDVVWQRCAPNSSDLTLPKEGVYYVQAQQLDQRGEVVAQTPPRRLELRASAQLPAPVLLGAQDGIVAAAANGSVDLRWRAVPKATGYRVVLKNAAGETVLEKTTTDDHLPVKDLIPGRLRLQIGTYNSRGVLSPPQDLGSVDVPSIGTLRPPTTRGIRVR